MSKIYGIPVVTPLCPGKIDGTGADGKSAYELAVAEGFEGSLQEWLQSLKGDPGPQGPLPIKGVDYLTPEEVEAVAEQIAENISPEMVGAAPAAGVAYIDKNDNETVILTQSVDLSTLASLVGGDV